jgi:hypothetical protein
VLDALGASWAPAVVPDGGWLVFAVRVTAMEPLGAFHARVSDRLVHLGESDGRLLPAPWEERRRSAREAGVTLAAGPWSALLGWARRLGVEPPAPLRG